MIENVREELDKYFGKSNSFLENEYRDYVVTLISSNKIRKWGTYNTLIKALKKNKKTKPLADEMMYSITNNESPRKVSLNILSRIKTKNNELIRLTHKLVKNNT